MRKRLILITLIWSIYLISCSGQGEKTIAVVHWNDFHSYNEPWQYIRNNDTLSLGGYAYFAGYIDSLRQCYPSLLALHAGDDFQGTPISSLTKGWSQLAILNYIRPHAFCIGNHEFDYGRDNLESWVSNARFHVVSCNLWDSQSGAFFVEPHTIHSFGNTDIAVIGVMSPALKRLTVPAATEGIRVLDPLPAVRDRVNALQDDAEIVILLSHMGFKEDSLLATGLSGVDMIFGGHSHTTLHQPKMVNDIAIFQAGSRGRYLGLLLMDVSAGGDILDFSYELIETVSGRITPDPFVLSVLDSLRSIEGTSLDKIIGELKDPWRRNRNGESNIGSWQCDAIRAFYGADIAFQNNGGIRKDLDPGPVRVRDIWEIAPFGNHFVKVTLTGKELLSMLEFQVARGGFGVQVSGLRIRYDDKTDTLVSVRVEGEPVIPGNNYTIVMNNYMFGQIYQYFGVSKDHLDYEEMMDIDRDIFIQAVINQETIRSKTDGRIKDISMDEKEG